jgi:hypothetical protein
MCGSKLKGVGPHVLPIRMKGLDAAHKPGDGLAGVATLEREEGRGRSVGNDGYAHAVNGVGGKGERGAVARAQGSLCYHGGLRASGVDVQDFHRGIIAA